MSLFRLFLPFLFLTACSVSQDLGMLPGGDGTGAGSCSDASGCEGELCIEDWPGGYCSAPCSETTPCPEGSHCSLLVQGRSNVCLADCDSNESCRAPQYECFDIDLDGTSECAAVGSGTGVVGDPCNDVSECAGGQRARCGVEEAGFYLGGYCTVTCPSAESCPVGSHCTQLWFPPDQLRPTIESQACMKNCGADGDCRSPGYACHNFDMVGARECMPAGTGERDLGEPCEGVWECRFGGGAVCLTDSVGFPGGMCTQSTCVPMLMPCREGFHCVGLGQTCEDEHCTNFSMCVESCETDDQCREGYECRNAIMDSLFVKECVGQGWSL